MSALNPLKGQGMSSFVAQLAESCDRQAFFTLLAACSRDSLARELGLFEAVCWALCCLAITSLLIITYTS
jgi:hypothetical protein